MNKRLLMALMLVIALVTTACRDALDTAADGMNGETRVERLGGPDAPGIERLVEELPAESAGFRSLPAPSRNIEEVSVGAWIPQGNTTVDGSTITVDPSGPWPDDTRTARVASAAAYATRGGDQWAGSVTMAPGVSFRAELRYYAGTTIVSTVTESPLVESGSDTSFVSGTAPAGSDRVRLRIFLDGVESGEAHVIRGASLIVGRGTEAPLPIPNLANWTPLGNVVVDGTVLIVDPDGPYRDDTGTARAGTSPISVAYEGQRFRGSLVMAEGVDFRAELRFFSGATILETVTSAPLISADGRSASDIEAVAPPRTTGVMLRVFMNDVEYGERHRILAADLRRVEDRSETTTVPPTTVPPTTVPPTTVPPTTVPPTTVPPTTVPPTTVPPTTVPPSGDSRAVVDASGWTGTVVLDQANTIYDFGNVSAGRDITIAASNVEARNIRGTGARRIGLRDGRDYVDSGFRDFEFTYIQTQNGGGGKLIRPYFVRGTDVNPTDKVADTGSPVHIYAYAGDVIDPLLDGIEVRGWAKDPNSTVAAHNDAIQFTGINGGRVYNPTLRNVNVKSGAAHGVLMRHVWGTVTVENSIFQRRFGAFFAFFGNAEDVSDTVVVVWRNNTLPDDAPGSNAAAFRNGWSVDPSSDMSLGAGGIVVLS
jgi:hypothetical protein